NKRRAVKKNYGKGRRKPAKSSCLSYVRADGHFLPFGWSKRRLTIYGRRSVTVSVNKPVTVMAPMLCGQHARAQSLVMLLCVFKRSVVVLIRERRALRCHASARSDCVCRVCPEDDAGSVRRDAAV